MSSDENVIAGVTHGALAYTEDKIKAVVQRFRNKEIAFVEDPEVINIAKEQRGTAEYGLLREYSDNPDFHILFQMGLTLRKLQRQQNRVESLRNKILKKYEIGGLHIAQLIQNGFFNRYLASALERARTPKQLRLEIRNLLDAIENSVVFVKENDNVDFLAQTIIIKISATNPKTFIICASGWATRRCREVEWEIKKWLRTGTLRYEFETYTSKYREVFLLIRLEE